MIIQVGPMAAHLGRQKQFLAQVEQVTKTMGTQIKQFNEHIFNGARVNQTENRAALHWIDRTLPQVDTLSLNNKPLQQQIENQCAAHQNDYDRLRRFADQLRNGQKTNPDGQLYNAIVHLGIGGSDFGPRLLHDVFSQEKNQASETEPQWDIRFIANVDFHDVQKNLRGLNPKTTLVIVTSKSFTTRETLLNANHVINWLNQAGANYAEEALIAVTSVPAKALEFGVKETQIFLMSIHVGGRFSVWGAVSLCIRIAFGNPKFEAFLKGGCAMDQHVLNNNIHSNLPALMAICDYINLQHGVSMLMLSPYDSRLSLLLTYVQQLWMESLGKGVTQSNRFLKQAPCPVLWGGVGTNSQHTFFQMLHQSAFACGVELIGVATPAHDQNENHRVLLSNFLAQAQAFAQGRSTQTSATHQLPNHLVCPGGRPTTSITLTALNAESLGYLLAFWEHRTIALAALQNINPFDQWGVETGKKIAHEVEYYLDSDQDKSDNEVTSKLIDSLKKKHA